MEESREMLLKKAKSRALYLLGDMPRTEMQLREKLRKNYPEDIVEEVIDYVKEYRYIDDFLYAKDYTSAKSVSKSRRVILMELKKKGISDEILERLSKEMAEEDQQQFVRNQQLLLDKLVRKKLPDPANASKEEQQKIYRHLLGKGFSYEEARCALERAVGRSS